MPITNCHVHTFTDEHVPVRFVRWPLHTLLRWGWFRRRVLKIVLRFDRGRRGKIARLAEVLEVSYGKSQEEVFERAQGYYPQGTRFVVLPMDMELMGAGKVAKPIAAQHRELAELHRKHPDLVIPFAAVDPRRPDALSKTVDLIEHHGFSGIKLYPPLGYHPDDPTLQPLYEYAEEHAVPVLSHCSRPAGVQYRGSATERMRTDPATNQRLNESREELLTRFTSPDAYLRILTNFPRLKLCLAHFGGAGDWKEYLDHPWLPGQSNANNESWLAKIADMIRSGKHPNLWTDISYTAFADDEYIYLLKVLLSDERILLRTLFGTDFYVVANAEFEERRRGVRLRAVLGEEVFQTIAEYNPQQFLTTPAIEPQTAQPTARVIKA